MKRLLGLCLVACLLISGCSGWPDGTYVYVKPYEDPGEGAADQAVTVQNYGQLCQAIRTLVHSGAASGLISVARYDQTLIEQDMKTAVKHISTNDSIAAYAVERIDAELGTSAGQPAIALKITYIHDRAEIMKIQHVRWEDDATDRVAAELKRLSTGLVLQIDEYEQLDFAQWVADYAAAYPELIMETPEVTVNMYPATGSQRVVELKFTYQSSREALRNMQSQVTPMFNAASLYAAGDGLEREKYNRLYTFLMERFDRIDQNTSITPAYSLLLYGVGDAKAFATVYAAMCRQAGLDCITVTGTRWGDPWCWNIICYEGSYYHVDLLRCRDIGEFRTWKDGEMNGYVWNYPAYPECK